MAQAEREAAAVEAEVEAAALRRKEEAAKRAIETMKVKGGADGDETESDAMPEVAEAAGAPGRQSSMVFAKSMRPGDLLP